MGARVFIPVGRGQVTVIDHGDYELIAKYSWRAVHGSRAGQEKWYVKAYIPGTFPNCKSTSMHRLLLGAQPGQIVDHIDNNSLNNCRSNLRFCTAQENARNRNRQRQSISKFKGVTRNGKRWQANLKINGQGLYLGTFATEEEAGKAYDNAAVEQYGEFARHNKIRSS